MDKIINASVFVSVILGLSACSSGDKPKEPDAPPKDPEKLQIRINATASGSRVTDNSFDRGDRVGIFVVNYDGNSAGDLKTTGNHVDNMDFSYSGSWTSSTPVYWKDEETHADFYLYYPYMANISSVEAFPFEVKEDQSTEQNYKASELLMGKNTDVAPMSSEVGIVARHVMSQANIYLEAGNGFSAESLAKADVAVRINGVRTHSTADLSTGTVTSCGDPSSVTTWHAGTVYKALLPPQSVDGETDLVTVTVDGRDFNLRKAATFESGKVHKFTVRLSKTSGGINVDISPWIDDEDDNGGTAE